MNNPVELMIEALNSAVEIGLLNLHVSTPGRVEAYDKAQARATVQPLIKRGYLVEGERVVETLPVITNVPVVFHGAGEYGETFPISKGSTVILLFTDHSLDRWLLRGGIVDPEDDRRHAFTDAIAIPGVRDFAHAVSNVPDDAWVIRVPSGAEIRLGDASASDAVMRKSDAQRFIDALDVAAPLAGSAAGTLALQALKTALTTPTTGLPWLVAMDSIVKVK